MAFYGSAVSNLSPILFRGNLFSEGVNIVFHADISYSMSLDAMGSRSFKSFPSIPFYDTNIGVGSSISSMFYDGVIISYLQDELFKSKIGSTSSSPNLYTYFDLTLREKSIGTINQFFTQNTETYGFGSHIILSSGYSKFTQIKDLWRNGYIDNDLGNFSETYRFNVASKTAASSTANRFSSLNATLNPAVYSEDVHGNLWSIYYSGASLSSAEKANSIEITEGTVETSLIGKYLNYVPRRNKPTYVITSSNEQENTADNLVGVAITTKRNVGYSTDTYKYNKPGLIVRRFDGYYLDPTVNSGCVITGSGPSQTYTQESFESWFNNQAVPLTTSGSAPAMRWYEGGSNPTTGLAVDSSTNLGGSAVVGVEQTIPECKSAIKNSFFGPLKEIDRLRTDRNGYSMMIVGYFSPQADGIYQFKLQSNGASFLWMANDADGFSNVYTGWNPTNALVACPVLASDRAKIYSATSLTGGITGANNLWEAVSIQKPFTKGKYYPFRLICGNPLLSGSTTTTFPSNGNISSADLNAASSNPSFLRFLFDVDTTGTTGSPGAATGSVDVAYRIDQTGYFYGESDVWKLGSQFFPPDVFVQTTTLEEEIKYRNMRIISISGYDSDDGYDGVFFEKDPSSPLQNYRYIKFNDPTTFLGISSSVSPFSASSNWRFANLFDPINYNIEWNSSLGVGNTIVSSEPVVGTGASFVVTKLNDRYLLNIPVGYAGTGFKTGDKIVIPSSSLGETDVENNLVLQVNEVQSLSYDVTTSSSDLFIDRALTNPRIFVQKNNDGNSTANYTFSIDPSFRGVNFAVNDRIAIPGTSLDGSTPTNDLVLRVDSVGSSGEIQSASYITGTASTYIDYNIPLNTYNPRPITFVGYTTQPISIGYTFTNSTSIGYTAVTANITGISYTTFDGIGIGNSAFSISGIAYTTSVVTNLSYITAPITSIGYTTRNVSIAGYTTTSVTSIGYTSPHIVSIGYTAFGLSNIIYQGAIGIDSVDKSGNADVVLTLNQDVSSILAVGGTIIISGTGDSRIDGQRTVTAINAVTTPTIDITSGLPNGSFTLDTDPTQVKLIVTSDNIAGDPVGYASTALLITTTNHTFNVGDSIIVRGVQNPSYANWNSSFTVSWIDSPNSVYLENTGTVGLFTATSISGVGVTVGYAQADLQMEITRPAAYQFAVGMGITVFNVPGNAAIYNDGYVIKNILASDGNGPYKFTLLENQTPSQLSSPGTSGRIGIHSISGIATVTSTSEFGVANSIITVKIQGSSQSFFNKVYTNAIVLDGTRILLGPDSYRDSSTPNPQQNINSIVGIGLTIGLVGSNLKITTTANHGFSNTDAIRLQDSLDQFGNSFLDGDNDLYTIFSIINPTSFSVSKPSTTTTDFGKRAVSGLVGLRANAILTTSGNHPFNTGDSIRIENTTGNAGIFNNSFTVEKLSNTTLYLNGTNGILTPAYTDNFADSTATGGIAGLNNSDARITYTGSYDFQTGQSIKVEGTGTTFDGNNYTITRISSTSLSLNSTQNPTTYTVSSGIGSITLLNVGPTVTYNNTELNSDISSILNTGDQIRLQGSTTGYNGSGFPDAVYTVKKYTNTTFGITLTDPTSFTGTRGNSYTSATAGLLGSKVRVRTSAAHGLQTGNTVRIQNASTFDQVYTIEVYDTTRFDLNNTVGTASTNYTLSDTSFKVGPFNYPATFRISTGTIPTSFATGRKVRLEGLFNSNSGIRTDVQYTITRYSTTALGLNEAINPVDFTINETNIRALGLEDSPARVNGPAGSFSSFGNIGQTILVNIQDTQDFNGDYNAIITSSTTLDLLGTENPVTSVGFPTTYNLAGYGRDTIGVIGLKDYNRIIRTPSSHTFTAADEGVTEIYVDVNNPIAEALGYDGTFTIDKVYSTTTFSLQNTQNPVSYGVTSSGYYVGVNTGVTVITNGSHYLDVGDQVVLSNTTDYNGTYLVQYVLSSNTFTLSNTYPRSGNNYTIRNTSGNFQPQISPNGGSLGNSTVVIRRGIDGKYYVPSVFQSGQGYKTGEEYLILGSSLGGSDGTNNAVVTVGSVSGGSISNIASISGFADNTLDYESSISASLNIGSGSGARFTIVRNGRRLATNLGITTYTTVTLTSGGSNYITNNIIRIPGNRLGGISGDGSINNLQNDLLIYVNNSLSAGSIVGSGITFTGISSNSAPLILSGISTIYTDSGLPRSRPWGLEEVWRNTVSPGTPPTEGGSLRQKHKMLELAQANKGGVFKAESVYKLGEYEKYARIEHLTFYPIISSVNAIPGASGELFKGSIVYDTGSQSGIATVIFSNDTPDGRVFDTLRGREGEVIYFLTSSHRKNPLARIEFIDYRSTGYGHTILNVNSSYGSANDPITGSGFNFTGGVAPFAFGPGVDQVVIQTSNTNAEIFNRTLSATNSTRLQNQNVQATNADNGMQAVIVSSASTLTVRLKGTSQTFADGDIVTIRYSIDPIGGDIINHSGANSAFFDAQSGIGFTSYRIRRLRDDNGSLGKNMFQCFDIETDIGIGPDHIAPNGQKMIDLIARSYVPVPQEANPALTPTVLYGGQLDSVYSSKNYGNTSNVPTNYPYAGAGTTVITVSGETLTFVGNNAGYSHIRIAEEGEAYVVGAGITPVDNRIAMTKAIAKFISDTSKN